jgi:hypothetical protein
MDYQRPVPPEESRRIAQTFGALYLITFAASIPAPWLYQPVLDDPPDTSPGSATTTASCWERSSNCC